MERYGQEAAGADRAAILSTYRGYLSALGANDVRKACGLLAAATVRSVEEVAPSSLEKGGCPAVLPVLLAPTAPAVARQQRQGTVKLIRVEGDQAFVIFHAPGARLYVFTLVREGGSWKSARIASSILAPLPAVPPQR